MQEAPPHEIVVVFKTRRFNLRYPYDTPIKPRLGWAAVTSALPRELHEQLPRDTKWADDLRVAESEGILVHLSPEELDVDATLELNRPHLSASAYQELVSALASPTTPRAESRLRYLDSGAAYFERAADVAISRIKANQQGMREHGLRSGLTLGVAIAVTFAIYWTTLRRRVLTFLHRTRGEILHARQTLSAA
jgi:hypothetical protein